MHISHIEWTDEQARKLYESLATALEAASQMPQYMRERPIAEIASYRVETSGGFQPIRDQMYWLYHRFTRPVVLVESLIV